MALPLRRLDGDRKRRGDHASYRTRPDAQGVFTGQIFGGRIKGFWNEAAQKIQFASYAEEGGGTTSPVFGIFEGYLFRTPLNPAPGRDVTATLVGSLFVSAQSVGLDVLPGDCPPVLANLLSAGWRSCRRRSSYSIGALRRCRRGLDPSLVGTGSRSEGRSQAKLYDQCIRAKASIHRFHRFRQILKPQRAQRRRQGLSLNHMSAEACRAKADQLSLSTRRCGPSAY